MAGAGVDAKGCVEFCGGDVGCLAGVEEEVDHADGVDDTAGPGVVFAAVEGGGAFSAKLGGGLADQLGVFVVEVLLGEGVGELGDAIVFFLHGLRDGF